MCPQIQMGAQDMGARGRRSPGQQRPPQEIGHTMQRGLGYPDLGDLDPELFHFDGVGERLGIRTGLGRHGDEVQELSLIHI